MNLSEKQAAFSHSIVRFLREQFPDRGGAVRVTEDYTYRYRLSYCERDPVGNKAVGGHPKSTHLSRLAQDIIIDRRRNDMSRWIVLPGKDPLWKELHDDWETIYGGSRMIQGDPGHFSFEHNGVR